MWKITNNLYLGNSSDGKRFSSGTVGRNNPPGHNMEFITMNVAFDLPVPADIHIGFVDGGGNPTWKIRAAVAALGAAMRGDKPVLVYCHEGRSRSVLTIAGWLVAKNESMIQAELGQIKMIRDDINPNPALMNSFINAIGGK